MYLKKLDLFGANFKTRLSDWETEQKSVLGGIVTLLLYSLSLAYFIYVCVQWSDNRILPRTTLMNRLEKYSEADLKDVNLIEFQFWKYAEHFVDPFQEQDNILMPLAVYQYNGVFDKVFSLLGNNYSSASNVYVITYDQVELVLNSEFDPNRKPVTELVILFTKCQPQYLKEGQSCASEEQITSFFNQGEFNPTNKVFEQVKKQIYVPITESSCLHQQIMIRQLHTVVDNGILFEQNTETTVVNDMSLLQSNVPLSFLSKILNLDSYMILYLRLDPIETYLQVTFPKIGEILASVGSIVSILLMTKYIVIIFNQRKLDEGIIDEVILMYCPKLKKFIKQRNTQMHINTSGENKQYQGVYLDLKEKAKEKLKLTNIIYEISRLQFMIQHLHGKQILQQSHQMGLQINRKQLQRAGSLDKVKLVRQNHASQQMGYTDFNILSNPTASAIVVSKAQVTPLMSHRNSNAFNDKTIQIF